MKKLSKEEINLIGEIAYLITSFGKIKDILTEICYKIENFYINNININVVIKWDNDIYKSTTNVYPYKIFSKSYVLPNEKYFTIDIFSRDFLLETLPIESLIETIATLIVNFLSKEELVYIHYNLRERLKELKGINLTTTVFEKNKSIEESLHEICTFLPEAWQYPEYAVARIKFGDKIFTSNNFKETPWFQKQDFETPDGIKGSIEIFYLKKFPDADEGPFLLEERNLLKNLAALISGSVSTNSLKKLLHENTERLKELHAINQVSEIFNKKLPFEKALQHICQILPDAWQYPEYAACRIKYGNQIFVSNNFSESPWVQRQSFSTPNNIRGTIEIFYLKEFPQADEGPFLKEERNLLINLANLISGNASKILLDQILYENRERVKELNGINQTSKIINEGLPIDETLHKICTILPDSWQYPEYTAVRIKFEDKVFSTPNFKMTPWSQSEVFTTIDNKKGVIEVVYLKEFPIADEGPFLKEERNLLHNIARLITGYINSIKAREFFPIKLINNSTTNIYEDTQKLFLDKKKSLHLLFNKQNVEKYIYLDMMKFKIREILFVATLYDSYILESEGHFFEQFMGDIIQYTLFTLPRITSVTSEEEALELLNLAKFDLVILLAGIDPDAQLKLAKKIKENKPEVPIYLLINEKHDINYFEEFIKFSNIINKLYLWDGGSGIFFPIVKSFEDKINLDNDTTIGLVRIILLVEDSIIYYSKYLQLLYSIIFDQIQQTIKDTENNELEKLSKIRSRPKVIHVTNYEDAVFVFNKYKDYFLCIISDCEFEKNGKKDKNAGIEFLKYVRDYIKDIPFILQSGDKNLKEIADLYNAAFIDKNSDNLVSQLKRLLIHYLSFGDFVFKDKNGKPLAKATNINEFINILKILPTESLYFHSNYNQFSLWLMGRGEIKLAKLLYPIKIDDFPDPEKFRNFLINTIITHLEEKRKGRILSINEVDDITEKNIISLSTGSFGGKGRGLAFINGLINNIEFDILSSKINIKVPKTLIIGTDEFQFFIDHNNLKEIINSENYEYIRKKFSEGKLTPLLKKKLEFIIKKLNKPLAIRSSSISEDSISRSFAGIFETYIIPNNKDFNKRLEDLELAIKLIYSSVFSEKAKNYYKKIKHNIDEEKMAIIIQEVVGENFKNYFYPHISGVASSYNFYPVSYMKPEEGIAHIAFGLGHYVVDGGNAYTFSPVYPRIEVIYDKDLLSCSQNYFVGVDLKKENYDFIAEGEKSCLKNIDFIEILDDPYLKHCSSFYDKNNDCFYPGVSKDKPLIINFTNIIKYNFIPLAATINTLLQTLNKAMGSPIEIEFAVNLTPDENNLPTFYLLQVKPMIEAFNNFSFDISKINYKNIILKSNNSVGNGKFNNIRDIIYVDLETFNNLKTKEMAIEIDRLNAIMSENNIPYILIGPGRWGSRDPFLGIPVSWAQISNAKVIVELGLNNYPLDASFGSHFFHNITIMNIGYLAIKNNSENEFIKWDFIDKQKLIHKTKYFKHIQFSDPLNIYIDGKNRQSIIFY